VAAFGDDARFGDDAIAVCAPGVWIAGGPASLFCGAGSVCSFSPSSIRGLE